MAQLNVQTISSPIGRLHLVAEPEALRAVIFEESWADFKNQNPNVAQKKTDITALAALQLKEYFSGRRKKFDVPYKLEGTVFQKKVWTALRKIPYGTTHSYKQQAEAVGNPKAVRAVGGTNGRNPLAIILPCHRVIGTSGRLTGYAGGLDKKEFLLKLEGLSPKAN